MTTLNKTQMWKENFALPRNDGKGIFVSGCDYNQSIKAERNV